MTRENIKIIGRKTGNISPEKRAEHEQIRQQAKVEFPPAEKPKPALPRTGVAAQIRRARKAQGLSWNAVAKLAGIPIRTPSATSNLARMPSCRVSKLLPVYLA
jgi:hypothetical protein